MSTRAGPVRIRPVEPGDRPSFDGFHERCFDAEYGARLDRGSRELMLAWARSAATDDLLYDDDPDVHSFGAFAGDRPVGTVGLSDCIDGGYVFGLYVEPGHTGRGIGTALLAHAIDTVPWNVFLQLRVVDFSTRAIRFYESIGFERSMHEIGPTFGEDVPLGHWLMTADRHRCATRLGVLHA